MRRTPVCVLLHAFPLTSRMWAKVRPLLADRELHTPDYRGVTRPEELDGVPPSLDVLADDVAALLDQAGVERAVVGGVSMGGYVAMAFARRHPARLAGLVLADTRSSADSEEGRAGRLAIAEELESAGHVGVLLEKTVPGLLGVSTKLSKPEVVEEVRAIVSSVPPRTAAWWQRAMAARPDSTPTLRTLAVPALVVVGSEDTLATPDDAAAMAMAIPDARLVTIPDAGHLPPLEAPEPFADALRSFLDELSGSAR
ncbi:MAG: alpha/beta fold hydrolase [Acidothermus sp.]|nr:alpha/beta fold hydrolase [Acidothermus sp.]MCL6537248.1 alpha/beta hydrolase [Acidothermus sp.]